MRNRWLAAAAGALLAAGAVAAGFIVKSTPADLPTRPPAERPKLMLLSSLPIVFPEELTLDSEPSPTLEALRSRYQVVAISIADAASLKAGRILLAAQPRAQPGEALVELDKWVRSGGRVLLLADPMLERPSERALGDPLRPPLAYADTGLLGHWGLRLDAPDARGPAEREVDDRRVEMLSPGTLVAMASNCRLEGEGLVARCRIGRGKATIVADADLLEAPATREANLNLVLSELARLED